jgi:3-methyladenine DNA glycosylase AlkD
LAKEMAIFRGVAKKIRKDHALAQALWEAGIHEARGAAGAVEAEEKMM